MSNKICLCAICRKMLYEGDQMADCKVWDLDGELDYIELAHRQCAIDSGDERWVYEFENPNRDEYEYEDTMTDVEADADVLRSAGYGTDEDYGFFGYEDYNMIGGDNFYDEVERDHDEPFEGE